MQRNMWFLTTTAALTMAISACDADRPPTAAVSSSATAAKPQDEAAVIAALRGDAQPGGAARSGAAPTSASSLLPPGHPPIDGSAGPTAAPAAPSGPPVAVKFDAPESWTTQPPANSFRKAQYSIAPVEPDKDASEVVVFYFGPGQGGSTAANLNRWRDQFSDGSGNKLPADAMKMERFRASDWDVVLVEVAGTFDVSMPGMSGGDGAKRANYRLIGGVVEVPGGSYFVKATGPDATIQKHRDEISKFILSAKPAN